MIRILLLFNCLWLALFAQAQGATDRLEIQLSRSVLQPGDSLEVTVVNRDSSRPSSRPSTLEVIIQNEQGARTRLRWPVIDGEASGTLYLPDSLPRGKYTLVAGLQQRFFELNGKVADAKGVTRIKAMLLAKGGQWHQEEIPVRPDGTFTIRNWLFEDNALVAFSDARNSRRDLKISISTGLDSTSGMDAVGGRSFYVGTPSAAVQSTLDRPANVSGDLFLSQGSVLPGIEVSTTRKSRAEQFDEMYSSALFQAGDERLISILDDPTAIGFPNVLAYLQGRVAGLRITTSGFNNGTAQWRGSPVTFFLDEVRVSLEQVANIPMADVAIVKAYPPPFMGAALAAGGALAVYTRRGGERDFLPPNRQVFRVKGYSPAATVLRLSERSF